MEVRIVFSQATGSLRLLADEQTELGSAMCEDDY